MPEALCGNGSVESGEACDDSNLVDNDGCTAGCLNEYLMVSHLDPGRVALYDARNGDYVRDLITETEAGTGFFPTYLTQVNGGDVYVADSNLDKIFRYSPADFGFEALVPAIQLGMTWSGDDLLMVDDPGISRHTTRPLTSAGTYSSLTQLWALERINDRFQVAADAGFGVVYQIDSTGQIAELELYDGAFATGLAVTPDGRLLIAETNADQIVELIGTVSPDAYNPLGAPLVAGRTVPFVSPFSVGETVSHEWLIGSANGLLLVDPGTGAILSTQSTDSIRAISRYVGP
jgi:cysteine-rich repeat protein